MVRQPALGEIHEKQSRCRATTPPHPLATPLAASLAILNAKRSLLNNRVQITVSVPPWSFASLRNKDLHP